MTQVAITLNQLNKSYKDWRGRAKMALQDVSLTVQEGEAFGFVGPNGAGKSTTIQILTGGLRPDSGEACLWGLPVANPLARKQLGYVPESPSLHDYLTPMEILRMGMSLHGIKVDQPKAWCMGWLERFSLAEVANKTLRGFSKGMAQRTALAHAMACQPRLLILDEPLSGLDPLGRRDVVEILLEYRQGGGTIFFSSHVLHDVERLADRFGLIHQGRLLTVQSPQELIGNEGAFSVRTLGHSPVAGMQADTGERWYAEVEQGQLWMVLQAAQAAGHQILEVKPKLSLEQAFLHFVDQ